MEVGGRRGLDENSFSGQSIPTVPCSSWTLPGTQIKGRGWKEKTEAGEKKMEE